MKNNKYQIGLFIGRFQPFHFGHLWLIKKALLKVNFLIIGIGSTNVKNNNNFLSYQQRKKIIQLVIEKEKIKNRIKKIVPLADYPNDDLWFKKTLEKTGQVNIIIGNNQWTNDIFKKNGYPVLQTKLYKRYLFEGKKIRQLIKQGKNWYNRLPTYLIPIIEKKIKK